MKPHERPFRFSRRGMTVIELLAASALAALLLVTASAVIGSLSAQTRALLHDGSSQPWRQQLVDQLYWDLANARWMHWQPDRLTLTGFGGKDFDLGRPTQRPCRVVYRVQQSDSQVWLFREETHLDSQTSSDARTELVCLGVSSLEIQSDESGDHQPDHAIPVPHRFRLLLHQDGDLSPLMDHVYFFDKSPVIEPGRSSQADAVQDVTSVEVP